MVAVSVAVDAGADCGVDILNRGAEPTTLPSADNSPTMMKTAMAETTVTLVRCL